MVDKTQLDYISSYVSKLLRSRFGRGPQSCQATLANGYLVVYIRGFTAPMEDILLKHGHSKEVDYARRTIIHSLLDELKGVIHATLGLVTIEQYDDWNYPNNTGTIVFVLEKKEEEKSVATSTLDIQKLEKRIGKISQMVQKVPDQMNTYPLTSSICIVERNGILIQIEKALIERGYEQELKFTKDELEKSYFHRHGGFDDIFQKEVRDLFIDWNFSKDKSLMVFFLKS